MLKWYGEAKESKPAPKRGFWNGGWKIRSKEFFHHIHLLRERAYEHECDIRKYIDVLSKKHSEEYAELRDYINHKSVVAARVFALLRQILENGDSAINARLDALQERVDNLEELAVADDDDEGVNKQDVCWTIMIGDFVIKGRGERPTIEGGKVHEIEVDVTP